MSRTENRTNYTNSAVKVASFSSPRSNTNIHARNTRYTAPRQYSQRHTNTDVNRPNSYASSRYSATHSTGANSARSNTYNRGFYSGAYNNTSEALALDYAPRAQHRPAKPPKRVVKGRFDKVKEAAPLSLIKTYATIAIVFALSLVTLCFYANNSSKREHLVALQDQVEALNEDNKYIKGSIEDNLDLKKLESEAVKLGLQKPAEYQIVNINVPKESYTVQYDTKQEIHHSLWDAFKNLIKGLIKNDIQ